MLSNKLGLFVFVLLCSCAHSAGKYPLPILIDEVTKNPAAVEGKRLAFSGLLKPMSGGYFLYKNDVAAAKEDFSAGLDVVFGRNAPVLRALEITGGKCAVVKGVFTAFDDDTVGTGYFRSTVGFVEAEEIESQDCLE